MTAFEQHAMVVEEYRFYVPADDRPAYDGAWRAYYMEEKGEDRLGVGFLRYSARDGGPALCCERIEAILHFTRPSSGKPFVRIRAETN
jgi:hypothetical protein